MRSRLLTAAAVLSLASLLVTAGCSRTRMVEDDLKLVDVKTGWYDAGIVGGQNKIVPSITLKLQNISGDPISRVQVWAVFRRADEDKTWGEHFVRAIGPEGLDSGKVGNSLVLRSTLGYTSSQSRAQMLQNREFVDAKVNVFGKHGSRTWIKMGEYTVERALITE
ncbi:MAG TPA: hypothetical protein VFD69_00605 [Vicinamibacterales bacterium]|nr:hypothetical protein [Vicinamibacterales bacterium]